MKHLLVFLSGILIDACWIAWIHVSERNNAWASGFISMLMAILSLAGLGETIKDYSYAPSYVLGLGVGSFCAVWWKGRQKASSSQRQ